MKSGLLTLLAVLFISAGCQQVDKRLISGIREGNRSYRAGDYKVAEAVLSKALLDTSRCQESGEAYYIRGLARMKLRQPYLAETDFAYAVELTQVRAVRANALASLGTIAYERGRYERSYEYYSEASSEMPDAGPGDWVLYRLGVSAQNIGEWDEAREIFHRLISRYSGSKAIGPAGRRSAYMYFTIQAGAFSKVSGAKLRQEQLRKAGINSRIQRVKRRKGVIHVVCVGRHNDLKSAQETLEKVKRVIGDARIVP